MKRQKKTKKYATDNQQSIKVLTTYTMYNFEPDK